MRSWIKRARIGSLALASLALTLSVYSAQGETTAPSMSVIDQLRGPETPVDLDVAALRQQALERIHAKANATALKRPVIAPRLLELPHFDFDVAFDPESTVIRPQSYHLIGRIADALSHPTLLPYTFIVVGHTEATGRRADNLTLSQRRADSIRAVLVGVFKISPKRVQALGLGEEQLKDPSSPASLVNARAQIISTGRAVAEGSNLPTASGGAPAKRN
jgi:OOP family OmpA-OmpF porin